MLASTRHAMIVETVNREGSASVVDLAAHLGISESTIRRDLEKLAEAGKLAKVHGGAVALDAEDVQRDIPLEQRSVKNVAQKRAIAQAAARMVGPDDFVFLDAGSSVDLLVDCLEERGAAYATNCVGHALKLASRGFEVIVVGGMLKSATQAMVGPDTNSGIVRYNFTLGFWGTNGVTQENGFTTPDSMEAEAKRLSMRQTLHRFVLADASKANRVSRVRFAAFEDATLVTSHLPEGCPLAGLENVMVIE